MSDSLLRAVAAMLAWIAASPSAGFLLVVCLQVGLIAAFAAIMATWLDRRQAKLSHGFWFSAVVLVLGVVPVHVILGGWPIPVSTSVAAVGDPVSPSNDSGAPQAISEASKAEGAWREPLETHQPSLTLPAASAISEFEPAARQRPKSRQAWDLQSSPAGVQVASGGEDLRRQQVASGMAGSTRRIATIAFSGLYLIGCLVILLRLVIGTLRLKRWCNRGGRLSTQAQAGVVQAALEVGLPTAPAVRLVDEVAMPLVLGLHRPVVLVPGNFESWTADEQRATLLHEMMHIRRGDMMGQLMAKGMRILYWFHPASWYLDRCLMEARERATDQAVVDVGMAAERYAETLLNIVSRVGCTPRRNCIGHAAIAMSASSGIEDRLKHILRHPPQRTLKLRLVGPCSVGVLVLLTGLTTVRIERVVAEDELNGTTAAAQSSSLEPVEANAPAAAGEAAAESGIEASEQPLASESDLFARIRDCEVLEVSGDEFDAIFTVSGQVLSPHGIPVEGAIVLLRESSTSRISSESAKFRAYEHRHLLRVPDVFARTTTDRDGKFEFRNVKSPALPKRWTNSWRGDVVAAHQDLGMGWLPLGPKQEIRRSEMDLTVVLRPTGSISGRFISPNKDAIADATVNVYRLIDPAGDWSGRGDFDLQVSQLTPRVLTDQRGHFLITGVPEGFSASISINHPAWLGGGATIATSEDVPLGKQASGRGYFQDQEIVPSPADVIADPGVVISGQVVDPDGQPVPDVGVSFASTIAEAKTDREGNFRLIASSVWVERDRKARGSTSELFVRAPIESRLFSQQHKVSTDDLLDKIPVSIQLEKGVLANGKVITEEGEPVPNAIVRPIPTSSHYGGTTDPDGNYQLLLTKSQHTLMVSTDAPGYALPTRIDLAVTKEAEATNWPQQRVDLSDGVTKQVPPFVVSKLKSLTVIASLPDGQPAVGATAIISDERPMQSSANSRSWMPPRMTDKSDAVMTNELGRAELWPRGVPTEKAVVEVRSTVNDQSYDASVPVHRAVDGVLTVVLRSAAVLEGRVLIDGRPVAGATVSIGQSTSMRSTGMGASVTTNLQQIISDKDGWYRAAVPQDKEYSVRVQSLPGDSTRVGMRYRGVPTADGRMRVRDFAFHRGDQEIAGRVIDQQGNGIPGAHVQILTTGDVSPDFWLGHQADSQFETDNLGRFHLKNVPAGRYRLRVSGPRVDNQSRGVPAMVMAEAGNTDVEVVLDPTPPPVTPRLQPRVIEPTQAPASQP